MHRYSVCDLARCLCARVCRIARLRCHRAVGGHCDHRRDCERLSGIERTRCAQRPRSRVNQRHKRCSQYRTGEQLVERRHRDLSPLQVFDLLRRGPALLASLFIPTCKFYLLAWLKLLVCHELHARVPNRPRHDTSGTRGRSRIDRSAAPSERELACNRLVQPMHACVQLVTRALA